MLVALACGGSDGGESPIDVDPRQNPMVTGVVPATASPGDVVMITGRNFGNDPSRVTVTLGSIYNAQVLFVAPTNIEVRIPQDAIGRLQIVVIVAGLAAIGPSIAII